MMELERIGMQNDEKRLVFVKQGDYQLKRATNARNVTFPKLSHETK